MEITQERCLMNILSHARAVGPAGSVEVLAVREGDGLGVYGAVANGSLVFRAVLPGYAFPPPGAYSLEWVSEDHALLREKRGPFELNPREYFNSFEASVEESVDVTRDAVSGFPLVFVGGYCSTGVFKGYVGERSLDPIGVYEGEPGPCNRVCTVNPVTYGVLSNMCRVSIYLARAGGGTALMYRGSCGGCVFTLYDTSSCVSSTLDRFRTVSDYACDKPPCIDAGRLLSMMELGEKELGAYANYVAGGYLVSLGSYYALVVRVGDDPSVFRSCWMHPESRYVLRLLMNRHGLRRVKHPATATYPGYVFDCGDKRNNIALEVIHRARSAEATLPLSPEMHGFLREVLESLPGVPRVSPDGVVRGSDWFIVPVSDLL